MEIITSFIIAIVLLFSAGGLTVYYIVKTDDYKKCEKMLRRFIVFCIVLLFASLITTIIYAPTIAKDNETYRKTHRCKCCN